MRASSQARPLETVGSTPAAPHPPSSLWGIMLGPFVNILDYNVVNVSLPQMMSGLATDVLTIREALVHALRDGFYTIVLVGMGSLVLILTMWPVRQR